MSAIGRVAPNHFNVFVSHMEQDAPVVEALARRLQDEARFEVWLDQWNLVPGRSTQQQTVMGMGEAETCAVCIGQGTRDRWFRQRIELALARQAESPDFRVIPVILPGGDKRLVDRDLDLRGSVNFAAGLDDADEFYLLTCGIKGVPPGRRDESASPVVTRETKLREKLQVLKDLQVKKLVDASIAKRQQEELVAEFFRGWR